MTRLRILIPVLMAMLAMVAAANAQQVSEDQLATNAALKYWHAFAFIPEYDEPQKEIIWNWHNVAFDKAAVEVIRKGDWSLTYLHRGAALPQCVWGLDIEADGAECYFPYLGKARQLARLAFLRGRYRFENGDEDGGIADALAVLKLARDAGRDQLLVSFLVRTSIEDDNHNPTAVHLLASYLPTLSPDGLRKLKAGLEALPAPGSVKEAWVRDLRIYVTSFRELVAGMEGSEHLSTEFGRLVHGLDMTIDVDAMIAAQGGTAAGLLAGVDEAAGHIEQASHLFDLPREEAYAEATALRAKAKAAAPLVAELVPDPKLFIYRDARVRVRQAALRAAIDVLREGPKAVNGTQDPCGDGPFSYKPLPNGGFTLISALPIDTAHGCSDDVDGYVSLTVGRLPN